MRQRERRNFNCLATATIFLSLACCPQKALAQQVAFDFVGYPQTWIVPDNVTSITVDVRGAQGGGNGPSIPGGNGGRIQTTLAVTPGETLVIYVGGRGGDLTSPNTAGPGGFNGGGTGGIDNCDLNGPSGGGGGASDIRQGGNGLANRVVVAGGGGGSECCGDASGGDGGDTTGMPGAAGFNSGPGGGGTQSAGGAGGVGCGGCNGNGAFGSLGQGGVGGNGNRAGGGGGGGYYGGGGGGGCFYGSGGGGGSSYSAGTNTIHTQGYQTGDGQVVIKYVQTPIYASSFQYPLTDYIENDGCLEWGETNANFQICGKAGQHLGDDVCKPAGTDVFAVANGVVKYSHHYKNCPNWEWLIVIEHTLPDDSKICSIYGHIQPLASVSPGDSVFKGQHIGDIVRLDCWTDHIHFSIYNGPYVQIFCDPDEIYCSTAGYMCQEDWPGEYLNPSDFINRGKSPLHIKAHSPVDLIVVDPDLDSIGASFNTIPGATYSTLNDSVFIGLPIIGEYNIKVVKDTLDQSGETTYTLTFQIGNDSPDTLIEDAQVPQVGESHTYAISTCTFQPGDANASGNHTLADVISTVNYIFNKPGFPTCPSNSNLCWLSDLLCRGDWNGSSTVTLADVVQSVNYLFNKPGGPWDPSPSGVCCQPVP